jgi:ketosteroid isomerase-like protein
MTTAADARSVVQSFYASLADGKPEAAFALCTDDIEWSEAEGNPLADRNPYRGAELVGEVVQYADMYRLCYIRGAEGIRWACLFSAGAQQGP